MRQIDSNPDYEDECASCPTCSSMNTYILDFFYPEPQDLDQRRGYQAECNNCNCFYDVILKK